MPIHCTHCERGFLNLFQIELADEMSDEEILLWIADNADHDVSVCDCCGNGEEWYGVPGEHYNTEDPAGRDGPYAYNGGLCECN